MQQGAPQGWGIGLGKDYLEVFTGKKGQKGGSGGTGGGISSWNVSWKWDSGVQMEKVPQGWGISLSKDYLDVSTGKKGQKGGSGWTAGGISSWKWWVWKDLEDFASLPSVFALSLRPVLPHGQLHPARTRHWERG